MERIVREKLMMVEVERKELCSTRNDIGAEETGKTKVKVSTSVINLTDSVYGTSQLTTGWLPGVEERDSEVEEIETEGARSIREETLQEIVERHRREEEAEVGSGGTQGMEGVLADVEENLEAAKVAGVIKKKGTNHARHQPGRVNSGVRHDDGPGNR